MKNKILIVDDDQDFVEATALLLKAHNYDVISASNGQEGFQLVKEESPDLIILDLIMNQKTEGLETAKAISKDAAIKDIPMILVTGIRNEMNFPVELMIDPLALPVKKIIDKPINPDEFLATIAAYITKTGKEHRKIISGLNNVTNKWAGKKGNLIMILHEIQNNYGYVPRSIAFELSRILDIPLARIYEVITFYNYFKMEPPGKHIISVCMGTACYLKGTPGILQELKDILHIEEGQTTKDGLFHLQIVRCLGCCGLAPVIMVDGKIYGKVKRSDIAEIVSSYSKEEAQV